MGFPDQQKSWPVPLTINYSRVDKQKNEPGTWKLRKVAIFWLFMTHVLMQEQADATLASLSILKYGCRLYQNDWYYNL